MTSLINLSIRLCLNLLLFTTFLLISSYQSNAQEKTVSFKDLVESTDSLNSPIYLYKGSPYSGVVSNYYENGKLGSKVNLIDGKYHGLEVGYHENEKIAGRINYKNGIMDGSYEEYYDNGKKRTERNFKNGFREGTQKKYHENGNLDSHGNYLNGKKVGVWKYYDESGKLIKSEKFD